MGLGGWLHPDAWKRHYLDAGYLNSDPRIAQARQGTGPFLWNEALVVATPELWGAMLHYGLHQGFTLSVIDQPPGISMLSLIRSGQRPIAVAEVLHTQCDVQRLARLTHDIVGRWVCQRQAARLPNLTVREVEVLQWTADGKSAQDIADILELSKNPIDFHIKNSVHKLNAPNKTAAVTRAALLGLLF